MTEFEPVPTPADLARVGLAKPIGGDGKKSAGVFYVSPEGHEAMVAPQMRNGLAARARDEARRANRD